MSWIHSAVLTQYRRVTDTQTDTVSYYIPALPYDFLLVSNYW